MEHATYFLTRSQYEWLSNNLPTPTARTKHVIPNSELLGGIVFVLRTGCRWSDIPSSICIHHYSSCWRRFNFWRKRAGIKAAWQTVLKLLDREGQIDLSVGNLDGTLVQSPGLKECTGYSGKHHRTGTSVSVLTEKDGLPLADSMAKGNRNGITAAERTVKKLRMGVKRRLKELNADKGYDSRAFRRNLLKRGITSNIPEVSVSTSTEGNAGRMLTWIRFSLSSGRSWSEPLPGLKATTDCGIATSARSACFRPW